jgi:hypothetical protein
VGPPAAGRDDVPAVPSRLEPPGRPEVGDERGTRPGVEAADVVYEDGGGVAIGHGDAGRYRPHVWAADSSSLRGTAGGTQALCGRTQYDR